MTENKKDQEAECKRDEILRTMLRTPPQPHWRPTNVRKKNVAEKPKEPPKKPHKTERS
jgi:hypothetical protein